MLLTGDLVDAARAERIGLVSAVVEPAELLGAAYVRAETIVANSPFGVRLTKQVLYRTSTRPRSRRRSRSRTATRCWRLHR